MIGENTGKLVEAIAKERLQSVAYFPVQCLTGWREKSLISDFLSQRVLKDVFYLWQPGMLVHQIEYFQTVLLIIQ